MAAPAILKIDIIADATKALRAMGTTETKTKGLSSAAKVGLAGATTAITAFGVSSVKEFVAAEEAQKALSDAFERFPKLAGTSQAELQKLNSELQKKTKYDDDAIASGQAVAAQFGLTGDQLKTLTPLMVDYASRTGKDIPSAAQDVGKAMLGNAKALKNIGIKYTATGDTATDFANIQALLNEKVGGFAEKEGTTAAGQAAILANQFGEVQETVGGALVPVLLKLAPILATVAGFIEDNIGWLLPLTAAIGAGVVAWKLWTAAVKIHTAATTEGTAVQVAMNAVMSANPIFLVVAALVALVAIVVLAYKNVDWFRAAVDKAWQFIQKAWDAVLAVFQKVWLWIKANWPLLLGILTGPIGLAVLAITKNWDTIKRVVLGVFTAIRDAVTSAWRWVTDKFDAIADKVTGTFDKVTDTINTFIRGWNRLRIPKVVFDIPGGSWIPGVPDSVTIGGWNLPNLPMLASGGSVMRTGLAVVHAGETFSGVGRTMGGGTVINVNVTTAGLGADAPEIQRAVVRALRGHVARNGPLDVPVRTVA